MITSQNDIAAAAEILKQGRLVALPTETVYGLGADASSDSAVASIYAAKSRPQFNPLIVHVPSLDSVRDQVVITPLAEKLAAHFWPGALTIVLPRAAGCSFSLLVSAGMDTVAIRCPKHPVAQALLAAAGVMLAAPSANRSGRISPTEAAHVQSEFAGTDLCILDGGACEVGLESTVVDCRGDYPVILRHGSVTAEMLEKLCGKVLLAEKDSALLAPGMLASHYAPDKTLRLNATHVEPGEALLAFGAPLAGSVQVENLSPSANLQEAAANLFKMLRMLDAGSARSIAAMVIPADGIGAAINDRLQRAAAPK